MSKDYDLNMSKVLDTLQIEGVDRKLKAATVSNTTNHIGFSKTTRSGKKFAWKLLWNNNAELEISASPQGSVYGKMFKTSTFIDELASFLEMGMLMNRPNGSKATLVLSKIRRNISTFNSSVDFVSSLDKFKKNNVEISDLINANDGVVFRRYLKKVKGQYLYSLKVSENDIEIYSKSGIEHIPKMTLINDINELNRNVEFIEEDDVDTHHQPPDHHQPIDNIDIDAVDEKFFKKVAQGATD